MELTNLRLRLLTYIVIGYMMLAFAWWSILLFSKNHDAFEAKAAYMRLMFVAQSGVQDEATFQLTPAYLELRGKYQRQEWMIFGEAIVFIFSLVIGIWQINRSYNREMNAVQQRRNFLLSITHELKSPIASIQLILETFIKRNLSKNQIDTFSETALSEAARLNALVNDLLLSAKLETAYQPNFEWIDLNVLLDDLVYTLQVKNATDTYELELADENPRIPGDHAGLTSVFLNLLENALKYADNPAHLHIKTELNEGHIHIHIADNGWGIADKEKKKVFQKFYRIGNEDTRRTKGTGLGLYIVHEIVKAHKGSISIADNTPKGTVFKVQLPLQNPALESESKVQRTTESTNNLLEN